MTNLIDIPKKEIRTSLNNLLRFRNHHFQNFVFIHINKTAGRSVVKALGIHFEHKTASKKIQELGWEKWNEKYTFTFVRNPWDRVASLYHFRVRTNQTGLQNSSLDFKDWVFRCYVEQDPLYYNVHKMFMPQLDWISDADSNLLVKFVGRFENLTDDFAEVCNAIGKDVTLPHVNKTKRKSYRDYYDDELIKIVGRYYEKDIDLFKYSFNTLS